MDLLLSLFPNVSNKLPEFLNSIYQTIYMVVVSGVFSYSIGLAVGVLLVVTKKGGILQNASINTILDKVINVFRIIPFVILLAALIPLTRMIMGTAIGTKGAIIPLIFGTTPFFARQVESTLSEMGNGLVEAALSMGSSPFDIIFRVYIRESIPGLIRALTITTISLIGLTAMAGAVGGGGLGDFALRYGHQRNQVDVTFATVIALVIMVTIIQIISNYFIRKTTH